MDAKLFNKKKIRDCGVLRPNQDIYITPNPWRPLMKGNIYSMRQVIQFFRKAGFAGPNSRAAHMNYQ